MASSAGQRTKARWAGKDLLVILALPIIAHLALALWTARNELQQLWSDPRDRLVLIAPVVVYGLVAAFCVLRRRRALLLAVFTYLAIGVIVLGEIALQLTLPEHVPNLPRQESVFYITRGNWQPGNPPATCKLTYTQLGVRGPKISDKDFDASDVRVLCVGGSTTENYYNDDAESWPFLLQQRVNGTAGKSVYVGNAGTAGSTTMNHIHLLRDYPHVGRFNWVVVLCGMNDGGVIAQGAWDARAATAESETFPRVTYRDKGPYWRRMELYQAMRNVMIRLGYDNSNTRMYMDGQGYWFVDLRTQRQELLKSEGRDDQPENLERDLERYRDNLREIIRLCRERGQNMVFMTQPTMYEENIAPELDALCWQRNKGRTFTSGALARLLRTVNGAMKQVCAEEGVDCVDLDARVPKNTEAFWDDCHFNINGNRIVADVLAEYFQKKLAEAAPN